MELIAEWVTLTERQMQPFFPWGRAKARIFDFGRCGITAKDSDEDYFEKAPAIGDRP
jgi:hypothetical protein